MLISAIVNGIVLGGLYAAIGIGMSMVFGIMRLTNIAQGDLMVFGAYMVMAMMGLFGNLFFGIIAGIIIMVVFGYLAQNFLVNKVIDRGAEPALLVMFGLSIIIQNVLQLIFGVNRFSIDTGIEGSIFESNALTITNVSVVNLIAAILIIILLNLVIKKTYLGRAIRAASDDVEAAELMGINTKRIYSYTMMIAMGITCLSGLLFGQTFSFFPNTGTQYLIVAFGVVVIGGMGSIIGTLVGGIILGVCMLIGGAYLGLAYQQLSGFVVLIIILTFLPKGIMSVGKRK